MTGMTRRGPGESEAHHAMRVMHVYERRLARREQRLASLRNKVAQWRRYYESVTVG